MPVYIYGLGYQKEDKFNIEFTEVQDIRSCQKKYDFRGIYYIGSTTDVVTRLFEHYTENGATRKTQWMHRLRLDGYTPFMRVFTKTNKDERLLVENSFIVAFNRLYPDTIVNTVIPRQSHDEALMQVIFNNARIETRTSTVPIKSDPEDIWVIGGNEMNYDDIDI